MHAVHQSYRPRAERKHGSEGRVRWLEWFFIGLGVLVVGRLFMLQIWGGKTYRLLASNQQELEEKLIPDRGRILARDRADGSLHPLATNRDAWTLFVSPRDMTNPGEVAKALAMYASTGTEADLVAAWSGKEDDPYEPVAKNLMTEQADAIRALKLDGVGLVKGWARFYPEAGIGGHLVGFVRAEPDGIGKGVYGTEGSFDEILAGRSGFVNGQKDAAGRRLLLGDASIRDATDGSDIVLTIDRTIQHEACRMLANAVRGHGADGGSVVILVPHTGAVLAMCSVPDFDPANYGATKELSAFNNPIMLAQYEPGSVFKAFTMAIGLDRDKILPKTTYTDTGAEEIDDFTIKNSDGKAHGLKTMAQALDESLNTATIFVQRLVGKDGFRSGIERFGFGKRTDVGLTPESKGDISSLARKGDIFAATGSFGQGITVTPIQLAAGYAALANGGTLMRPYLVDEVLRPDGTRERTKPQTVGQAVSPKAARLITGMLVSTVELGHGKRAGVPGYYVAGKTGTAQVADPNGKGYLKDVTIGSFAGYAPANDPKFAMLVKIDHPRDVQWAEASAAPLWGNIASFVLSYLDAPMERPMNDKPDTSSTPLPGTTSTPVTVTTTAQ